MRAFTNIDLFHVCMHDTLRNARAGWQDGSYFKEFQCSMVSIFENRKNDTVVYFVYDTENI